MKSKFKVKTEKRLYVNCCGGGWLPLEAIGKEKICRIPLLGQKSFASADELLLVIQRILGKGNWFLFRNLE